MDMSFPLEELEKAYMKTCGKKLNRDDYEVVNDLVVKMLNATQRGYFDAHHNHLILTKPEFEQLVDENNPDESPEIKHQYAKILYKSYMRGVNCKKQHKRKPALTFLVSSWFFHAKKQLERSE